jgi:hypothetical protein
MYNMKLNQDSWHWSIMESVTITQRVLWLPSTARWAYNEYHAIIIGV